MPSISWEICRSSSRLSLTIVSLQEVDPRLAVGGRRDSRRLARRARNASPVGRSLKFKSIAICPQELRLGQRSQRRTYEEQLPIDHRNGPHRRNGGILRPTEVVGSYILG